MATIYDIDFSEFSRQTLPPDKRGIGLRRLLIAFLKPLQYRQDIVLKDYRLGSPGTLWLAGSTYAAGDKVVYNGSAYESLVDANTGNLPTNNAYWLKTLDNFIGVEERLKYNTGKLVLEYAANKYFQTTFRQPPLTSDIYFSLLPKQTPPFIVGAVESQSSVVTTGGSNEVVINEYSFTTSADAQLFIPQAVYDALDADPANRDKIVRLFIDKYILAGISYIVTPY